MAALKQSPSLVGFMTDLTVSIAAFAAEAADEAPLASITALPLCCTRGRYSSSIQVESLITSDAIAGDPDSNIYISRKTANLYYQALAREYNLPFLNDGLVARYAGYNIIAPAGFPDDTAILSKKDNLYFGTNVLTDMIEARILDLTAVTGSAVTRVALLFDAGTQIVDEASMACVRRSS